MLSCLYISFSGARIPILTKEESKIDDWIELDVNGILYNVDISEEMYNDPIQDCPSNNLRRDNKKGLI